MVRKKDQQIENPTKFRPVEAKIVGRHHKEGENMPLKLVIKPCVPGPGYVTS